MTREALSAKIHQRDISNVIMLFIFRGEKVIVSREQTTWTYEDFTLKNGALYTIQVSAVNVAGLTAAHETTGVIVDTTKPVVKLSTHFLHSFTERPIMLFGDVNTYLHHIFTYETLI